MNKIPNRQAICEVLMEQAKTDKNIVVLCSDSRGSASLAPFAAAYPDQFVEIGIAEQNLVSIAAGLADAVFAFLLTPPFQFLLIPMIAAQSIQTILLSFDGGVEYSAAALTMKPADVEMSILTQHPFLIMFL